MTDSYDPPGLWGNRVRESGHSMRGATLPSAAEAGLLLAVLGAALFVYRGAFLGFFEQDDFGWLYYSRFQSLKEWISCFFRFNGAGNYRPLSQETFFWLGQSIFGLRPAGFHVVSAACHLLASVLVYRLLRLFCAPLQALPGTLFFAVHNAHFSSLYWVSALPEPLALVFYLAALIAFIRSDREERPGLYILSLFLAVLALLSKESILSLPLVLAAYCLLFSRAKLFRTLPFFLLPGLYLLLRVTSHTVRVAPYPLDLGREAWGNLCAYLSWTAGFSGVFLRFKLKWNPESAYPWIAAALAFLALALLIRSRARRVACFAVLWYVFALQPVLYFSNHAYSYYLAPALPAIGLLLASSLRPLRDLLDWRRWIPILALLYLCIGTSLASIKRQGLIWNSRSFIARDIIAGMPVVEQQTPAGHKAFILGISEDAFGAMQGEHALRLYGYSPERFVLVGVSDRTLRELEDVVASGAQSDFFYFHYERTGFTNVTDQFRRNPQPFLEQARRAKPLAPS